MTLTINDTIMTSDQTAHTARQAPGRQHQWEVSWLPGQPLDRNTAITAMLLADITGKGDLHEGHRLWPHIQGWAAELGLTGTDAIARAAQPPGDSSRTKEKARTRTGGGTVSEMTPGSEPVPEVDELGLTADQWMEAHRIAAADAANRAYAAVAQANPDQAAQRQAEIDAGWADPVQDSDDPRGRCRDGSGTGGRAVTAGEPGRLPEQAAARREMGLARS